MPRATRNTNTNSGKEVSAPPNPNTWLKKKALTPRAAANDSTTVAVRITGATSARSNNARITSTTTRMSGMMRFRSCADARATSRLIAVLPPTSALAPGTACTAERTRSIVLYAAWVSGADIADDDDRIARASGEMLGDHALTDHRIGCPAEGLRVGQAVGLQAGQPERQDAQNQGGRDPCDPRPGCDAPADPRPQPPGRRLGRAVGGPVRPEHPARERH